MSPSLPLVYIIIPVHNRKVITLTCLNTLQCNGDMGRYRILVIDDGSTDGTAEAISRFYPDVTVLPGDGNLWWTGSIAKGMKYAVKNGADYFIWLNDDTLPLANALPKLVHHCSSDTKRIATAQCYTTDQLIKPTYGGQLKHQWSIQLFSTPQGRQISCDCMSGNLVCLPRNVIDEIGYPPAERLPHCRADIVYTLMAKRAGYDLQVIGDAIAISPLNPFDEGWIHSPISNDSAMAADTNAKIQYSSPNLLGLLQ
jgi:GT2 family glycosyltransferase